MWKDFFYFTHTERQGIIVLVVLILAVLTIGHFVSKTNKGDEVAQIKKEIFQKEYSYFMKTIRQDSALEYERKEYYDFYHKHSKVELIPFDPNKADSFTLVKTGMYPWMVKNILRYRLKGGKFYKPEDLKKIYGMTNTLYDKLSPYLYIESKEYKKDTINLLLSSKIRKDTLYKYPTGTKIDLNHSDTTELKKIPGIGSGISKMIIGYRKKLGNYYSVNQLKEINLNVEKLKPWFIVNRFETIRININKSSIRELMRHPYINFYQAKVIVEYVKKKGNIQSLKQLRLLEEFNAEDFERLEPYIGFN